MENIKKICFQGLKLQNKLLANMISTSFLGYFFANSLLGGRTKYPGNEVKVDMWFAYGPEIMQKKEPLKLKCTQCSCLGKIQGSVKINIFI